MLRRRDKMKIRDIYLESLDSCIDFLPRLSYLASVSHIEYDPIHYIPLGLLLGDFVDQVQRSN